MNNRVWQWHLLFSNQFFPDCVICVRFSTYIINNYYMVNPVLGKSLCSDWFFLGQDCAVRTVSMQTVQPVYFCLEAKPANSKFTTKTAKTKKNCECCHSSQWNYQKKLQRLKFFRNFKDGWRRRTFSKRVLLSWRSGNFWCRNWNRHHRNPGCHIINNLLTELARAVLGNIGPRSWLYVLPRPRANIPQYSPRARLVSG